MIHYIKYYRICIKNNRITSNVDEKRKKKETELTYNDMQFYN